MATTDPEPLPISRFDYALPPERIAQVPIEPRDAARMLILKRDTGQITHSKITDLPNWLNRGDLIVANNTRVFPARLKGRKRDTGGVVELLLLHELAGGHWQALARPVRKLRPGALIVVPASEAHEDDLELEVVAIERDGEIVVESAGLTVQRMERYGSTPLPPYITAPLSDSERYQTLHATVLGSAAAPTAGLHITAGLRSSLINAGIDWAEVTLHVGLDTFRPVSVEDLNDHHIHQEWFAVPAETHRKIGETRDRGGRVVALGTTSARTLETLGALGPLTEYGNDEGVTGTTDLFIRPGHEWTVVDAMLTNFHLPRSTLLVMISALAGRDQVLNAYDEAIAEQYRFFSFGDAMLII